MWLDGVVELNKTGRKGVPRALMEELEWPRRPQGEVLLINTP
jgi:hypothetical protein